jgi:hypothetical protein
MDIAMNIMNVGAGLLRYIDGNFCCVGFDIFVVLL